MKMICADALILECLDQTDFNYGTAIQKWVHETTEGILHLSSTRMYSTIKALADGDKPKITRTRERRVQGNAQLLKEFLQLTVEGRDALEQIRAMVKAVFSAEPPVSEPVMNVFNNEVYILQGLVQAGGENYGYGIIDWLAERTDEQIILNPGIVYPKIKRLAQGEYAKIRPSRKQRVFESTEIEAQLYELTEVGTVEMALIRKVMRAIFGCVVSF